VFRIIAEAIHNVVRHAGAGKVTIRLTVRDDRLTVTVADDGQGIQGAHPAGQPNAGFGLTTMRERAERWGGTVTVGPGRSAGTLVHVAVPLAEETEGIPLSGAGSAGRAR
jgi:signal transduction histidine kinase